MRMESQVPSGLADQTGPDRPLPKRIIRHRLIEATASPVPIVEGYTFKEDWIFPKEEKSNFHNIHPSSTIYRAFSDAGSCLPGIH